MQQTSAAPQERLSGPALVYGWYTVVLLTLAYILSFVDRYILGLLIGPIKADLGLSDTQIGLLLGPAFAVFYVLMGLPLGWLADRGRRTWIVGAGIILWSAATAWCGLAKNFVQLGLARISVGIGEATLSPCALSMIADRFPEEQRGKPVAFYSAALSVGAGVASLVGASVLAWTGTHDTFNLPVFGELAPWQVTFLIVAAPGFPLAIMMLTLKEPMRQSSALTADGEAASMGQALGEVGRNWKAYVGLVSMVCAMTVVAYSQGWLAAMFDRTFGWETSKYALYNGIGLLIVGPLTVSFTGWYSDRMYTAGKTDASLRMVMAGLVLLLLTGVAGPLMPTAWTAFGVLVTNNIGISMLSAAAPVALLNITPGAIRGQVVALYYITISVAGLMLGPTMVGVLNDVAFGEAGIRYSLAVVPVVIGLPVVLMLMPIRKAYLQRLETLQ
ncbi:MFS transporter [Halioglobus maricola]|uniref:MFS transporter n=1 Tax=Halioglobus maricola TaxID=2601894 RepID=A0A5P9NIC7_9GAMM|nr:MFS transporter [Halioglobus maricola]QFU75542.1 MFS transporter [Halioglobus maricola]